MDCSISIDYNNPKEVYKTFMSNKVLNANILIDLLKDLEGSDSTLLKKSILLAQKIFCQLIKDGDLKDNIKAGNRNAKEKYDKWLHQRYLETHERLLFIMMNKKFPIGLREISLLAVIKLIQVEATYQFSEEKCYKLSFPLQRFSQLYSSIFSSEENLSILIKRLKKFFELQDFSIFSLAALSDCMPKSKQDERPQTYLDNLISVMELIHFSELNSWPAPPKSFLQVPKGKSWSFENKAFPYKEAKVHFNEIWDRILQMDFSTTLYKRCLILIPERVLVHLNQPVRLADYFLNAYNMGGVISLLAMQGVYILVTQYNLEYPDFYDKVYAMLDLSVFHAQYKRRFFMLCNKFFMSPYLPEYIVAAFIKKSSRLMLSAPSSSLVLLVKFVVILLLRFPSLQKLIHSPSAQRIENDPFLPDENCLNCLAGQSSLWEVATLKDHPLPGISKAANFIFRNLPDAEYDLSRFVNSGYNDIYDEARKIRKPETALTFTKPTSLFTYPDDTMSGEWDIL